MKKLTLAAIFAIAVSPVLADDNVKAGLWELHITKQVVDGKDMTAQMAAAQRQMQDMLASMPPDQRKMREQAMGGQAMQLSGVQQICISPEMAKQDKPVVSANNSCEPSNVQHNGNKTTFELNCPNMRGRGESISGANGITNKMDVVTTDAYGRHTMKSESQMKYLGADCKGIKPLDEVARDMKMQQSR